jgi:guanosine-3',5'-bis(diphosphate) 3'-pyrophosphohydrolase
MLNVSFCDDFFIGGVKMNNIELHDLLDKLKEYNFSEIEIVKKAYEYAANLHSGQTRQSGEPYVSHPLNVAYILAEMHADRDAICAGLLHDTLEDTNTTKEDISHDFNQNVANLVDGVTKLSKMNFSSKQDQNYANTRKIITGITEDVRIIIIKLADRLHNMRTLQFKSEFKQKENSIETMEIFVPLAYYIGAYRIKSELEDLSLKYLKPDMYRQIEERKVRLEQTSSYCLTEMLSKIEQLLKDSSIPNEIKVRTKNIYGIYKRLSEGHKLSDIHDLLALKIMVDNVENCYRTLGMIHSEYHPINDKFKDYICNPKTNMYRSLHTTVFGPDDKLVQTQIRTFDMDKVASFGLTAYWDEQKGKARDVMQEDLKQKFQFFKSLTEINSMFGDNQQFVKQVKSELFADRVYVYTTKGDIIELPKGSTPIDFAYKIHTDIGNTMVGVFVNDEYVPIDYILQNKDRVRIVTDDLSYGPREDWIDKAHTSLAKKKIREFNRK